MTSNILFPWSRPKRKQSARRVCRNLWCRVTAALLPRGVAGRCVVCNRKLSSSNKGADRG